MARQISRTWACAYNAHPQTAFRIRLISLSIALFRAGRLPVDQLLTHRLKLEEINEGFDRLREGIGVRQVIVFE